jgi:hypothetical protein
MKWADAMRALNELRASLSKLFGARLRRRYSL